MPRVRISAEACADMRIAEESFLVLGLTREAAVAAGRRHGQNAVVWGEAGEPAQLLDSREDGGLNAP